MNPFFIISFHLPNFSFYLDFEALASRVAISQNCSSKTIKSFYSWMPWTFSHEIVFEIDFSFFADKY